MVLLVTIVLALALNVKANNLTLAFDNDEVRLRREAWTADEESSKSHLGAFKADTQKTGSVMGAIWSGYNTENQPNMQVWQGSLGSAATGQQEAASYPQGYGSLPGTSNPNSPYAGYLEKQIRDYPVMIYSLNECVPCQRAKQLIATSYPDARAHYLDLSGNEPWQMQLQSDLMSLTGANTFPFIFVSGSYIGGFSELYELHENGQLRRMLNQSLKLLPKN